MKKTSLADIAKALGVSKTLVSMVMNDQGDLHGINPDTQEKVKAKAKELNYKANPIARGLRTGKSNIMGLIVADISNNFFARMARSIEDKAAEHGYNLIFCSSDESSQKEEELIQMLRDRQVDGLIVSTTFNDDNIFKDLQEENYPFVLIDRHIEGFDSNYVAVDNYKSTYDAISRMIKAGNKRIAFFTITPEHLSPIQDRMNGYLSALEQHDIALDSELIRSNTFGSIREDVFKNLDELFASEQKIDALFAVNNSIAIACVEYAKERGLNIPDDFVMMSFDDIPLFKFSQPTISAIAQPVKEIGENAVEILINSIKNKGKSEVKQMELPGEVTIRESFK